MRHHVINPNPPLGPVAKTYAVKCTYCNKWKYPHMSKPPKKNHVCELCKINNTVGDDDPEA